MENKPGKMMTYNERLPSIKPHDPLIMTKAKSHDNLKKVTFQLSQNLQPVNLAGS